MSIITRFLVNLLGIWLAVQLVSGFAIQGGWQGYVVAGLVLALLNLLLKPILRAVTFPLILLSLGLFGLIINAVLLKLASWLAPQYLQIDHLVALLLATVIITAVNVAGHWL